MNNFKKIETEKALPTTSGLAQAGAEVFWLEGSAVNSPAFAKPRGVVCKRAKYSWQRQKNLKLKIIQE